MSDQVDIAVDLGVLPPPLPDIEFLREFAATVPQTAQQIIEGILHQGCKMILGGTSKSNKSGCLLDVALSERQRRESSKAFVALKAYLELGTERQGSLRGSDSADGKVHCAGATVRTP